MAEEYEDIEILGESEQASQQELEEGLVDPREYLADIPTSLVSGVLGLTAFMLACVVGLLAENPGHVVLLRAILAMIICAIVGRFLGIAGEASVREFVVKYKSTRPRPRKPQELLTLEADQRAHARAMEHMKKASKNGR